MLDFPTNCETQRSLNFIMTHNSLITELIDDQQQNTSSRVIIQSGDPINKRTQLVWPF